MDDDRYGDYRQLYVQEQQPQPQQRAALRELGAAGECGSIREQWMLYAAKKVVMMTMVVVWGVVLYRLATGATRVFGLGVVWVAALAVCECFPIFSDRGRGGPCGV
jgi:hypothetical protein